jgi:nucleoside-diphosphate-sugar epimerase
MARIESKEASLSKLIIGCGYVGHPLAMHWLRHGTEVYVTTRTERRARDLQRQGFQPVILDVTKPVRELPTVETIVFAVGFDRAAGHSIEHVYVDGLNRVLDACDDQFRKFIYVSSTGVYGETGGDWVDESTPCVPIRDGGKACLAAEQSIAARPDIASKALVLRMAGIYGPQRLPQLAKLQGGEPLGVIADGYLNLIHVDDIVQIIAECDRRVDPGTLCVSDGHPVRRGDFYNYLAKLTNAPPPVFEPPAADSSQADRARGSKKISNLRLLQQFQRSLLYPSYREGLRAIVGQIER